jgi:2-polyprenyl-3-methyl-5-hydroxy-6-metoxy-1,4-benzoquinol methylase
MKALVRRIPGAVRSYRQARIVYSVAAARWRNDRERMNDHLHLVPEWDFGAPAVQERNARILRALGEHGAAREQVSALEVGCADGIFTRELAARGVSVTACDISSVARARAAERCAQFPRVTIRRLDLERDAIPGQYDWIFAMDVLEYIHGRDRLGNGINRLAGALRPDGVLVVTGCRLAEELRTAWWNRWLPEGADALLQFMDGRCGLQMVHREAHPEDGSSIPGYIDHLIALFRRS